MFDLEYFLLIVFLRFSINKLLWVVVLNKGKIFIICLVLNWEDLGKCNKLVCIKFLVYLCILWEIIFAVILIVDCYCLLRKGKWLLWVLFIVRVILCFW